MKVGFIGLGKLGYPLALAADDAGCTVAGYDTDPAVRERISQRRFPWRDRLATRLALTHSITWRNPEWMVANCDLIMVVVPTPHSPQFGGDRPLVDPPEDFDYTFLRAAVADLAQHTPPDTLPVAVVSTVLPGTMDREIKPLLGDRFQLVYNPSFVAMGEAVEDFTDPEFVLIGADHPRGYGVQTVRHLHELVVLRSARSGPPIKVVSLREAELAKVAYNAYVGFKLAFANSLAQLCDATGADVDTVTGVLGHAHRRLHSASYTTAGMGDGGACHPRDQIALSWLWRRHHPVIPAVDPFHGLIQLREDHTRWIARLAKVESNRRQLPIVILGRAYKAESDLEDGSPALLLRSYLPSWPSIDPISRPGYCSAHAGDRAVFVLATNHSCFRDYRLAPGSVVLDPWGDFPPQADVEIIRPGRRGEWWT